MDDRKSSACSSTLILNGLPPRTQLIIDGHSEAYLTNDQFEGIKSLPPGWHCVSWSVTSSESSSQTGRVGSEGSVRNILLRWFKDGEISVRELDRVQQRLVDPGQLGFASSFGRSKQTRTSRATDPSSKQASTIISPDVLNSLEPKLLPYPSAAHEPWQDAIRHLSKDNGCAGRKVVARVLGVDVYGGDSTTDSLSAGPSQARDAREQAAIQQTGSMGRRENGKIVWGKSRPESEREALESYEVDEADDEEGGNGPRAETEPKKRKRQSPTASGEIDDGDDEDSLLFTSFDLRRSWPPNSIGADITRWSEDKSWLLQDVASRCRLGITDTVTDDDNWYLPLLCEFELSFILFIMASNIYAWEQWKDLIALMCRSSSLIGAQSAFQLHPSITADATSEPRNNCNQIRLDGHTSFLNTLRAQLNLLDSDFWSTQTSSTEEQAVLKQVDVLRANLARSLSAASLQTELSAPELEQSREKLVTAWRSLSHLTAHKFGWQLDRRLDEEAEVEDDMQAEEGEDAPVVVEL